MDSSVIKVAVIEETLYFESVKNHLNAVMEGVKFGTNFSVIVKGIPNDEAFANGFDIDASPTWDVDVFLYFCELSYFPPDRTVNNRSMLSRVICASYIWIVSSPPRTITVSTIAIIHMDIQTVACLIVGILSVSLCMSISVYGKRNLSSIDEKKTSKTKNMIFNFLDNIWMNLCIIFFEPYSKSSNKFKWRVVAAVWLLAAAIISIELTSHMKSEFGITKYYEINTVDDLLKEPYEKLAIIKDGTEEKFIESKAKENKLYEELQKRIKQAEGGFYMDPVEIVSGVIFHTFLKGGMHFILSSFPLIVGTLQRSSELMDNIGRFYLSKPLYAEFVVVPVSRNCSKDKFDRLNFVIQANMENEVFRLFFTRFDYLVDRIQWRKTEHGIVLDLENAWSLFEMYSIGIIISFIVLASEIAFRTALTRFLPKQRSLNQRRRRHQRCKLDF